MTIRITGSVFSGSGEASAFTNLPWFKEAIVDRYGFVPHPGTLNIRVTAKRDVARAKLLSGSEGGFLLKAGSPAYCDARLFQAFVDSNVKCVAVVPKLPDYPKDVVELVAASNLRRTLGLSDGVQVSLELTL